MDKRQAREKIIDAGLLALARAMEDHGPLEVLHDIFGQEDLEPVLEVFASMMNRRDLWDAHLNGWKSQSPPPTDDIREFLYIPGHIYPYIGRRPVKWGSVTKMHYSEREFRNAHLAGIMQTLCGLTIPTLAIVYPEDKWHPGSDETCRLCLPLKEDP